MLTLPFVFYYCGYQKCSSGHYFGPAVRSQYLLHFVLSGKGIFRNGSAVHHIEKNQAFLICPRDVTYYEADTIEPWEYVWFGFDGDGAKSFLDHYGLNKDKCVCYAENEAKLFTFLRRSLSCFRNKESTQTELAGWFFLFFSCMRGGPTEQIVSKSRAQSILEYIRNNYNECKTVEDLSTKLNIDRSHLYKLCKKHTNMSPKELLTQRRLSSAKDLLRYSKKSITTIALTCGFTDSSSFSKVFKLYEQMRPTDYRKNNPERKGSRIESYPIDSFMIPKVYDV